MDNFLLSGSNLIVFGTDMYQYVVYPPDMSIMASTRFLKYWAKFSKMVAEMFSHSDRIFLNKSAFAV